MLRCSKCGEWKDEGQFRKCDSTRGYRTSCILCEKLYRDTHKEQHETAVKKIQATKIIKIEGTKICKGCGIEYDINFFPIHKTGKDGHRNYCNNCRKASKSEYYQENKEQIDAKNKAWQEENREARIVIQKAYYDKTYRDDKDKVYFITDGEYIKIGYTKNKVVARITTMETGNPRHLEVLGVFLGTKQDEARLHKMFGHLHVVREWFAYDKEIVEYIERCKIEDLLIFSHSSSITNIQG